MPRLVQVWNGQCHEHSPERLFIVYEVKVRQNKPNGSFVVTRDYHVWLFVQGMGHALTHTHAYFSVQECVNGRRLSETEFPKHA